MLLDFSFNIGKSFWGTVSPSNYSVYGKQSRKLGSEKKYCNKKSPRGIIPRRCCPSPRVQNISWPPKIQALTFVAKDVTSICLAKRKPEVWGK